MKPIIRKPSDEEIKEAEERREREETGEIEMMETKGGIYSPYDDLPKPKNVKAVGGTIIK